MDPVLLKLNQERTATIRQAIPSDAALILSFLDRVASQTNFLSFGPGEFGQSEAQVHQQIERWARSKNQIQIVAVFEGRIAGSLTFIGGGRPRTMHIGELGMSVDADFWRQGVGGGMLDFLVQWARETKIVTKLNLRVAHNNHGAQRLYESRGFVREGTITRDMVINGQYVDHHVMGLEL